MGFCVCFMFCYASLCDLSSFPIILMGKKELVALPNLSYWCLVNDMWLFLTTEVCDCNISRSYTLFLYCFFSGGGYIHTLSHSF